MKRFLMVLLVLTLTGCNQNQSSDTEVNSVERVNALPQKSIPESTLANESPLDATNIDDYLFIDGVTYIDLRDANQLLNEGSIAGFVNIPFYNVLVSYEPSDNVLFSMNRKYSEDNAVLGSKGTFKATYEESEWILNQLFPKNQPIVFMSTAGVEASYMIALLTQLGYDPSYLYNAGTFTNGMGDVIAYKDYSKHRHYIQPNTTYTVNLSFDWGELTPITE